MSTFRELIYLTLDELKLTSDDSYFTEEHIAFILSKYRTFLLKQRYSDIKKQISESNYQTICVPLNDLYIVEGSNCENTFYFKNSMSEIPFLMTIGNTRVYEDNYYQGNISFVSRDRMKYIGYNKYLSKVIYSSISPNNHLILKSSSEDALHNITNIKITGIFQDIIEASKLSCSIKCDLLDMMFPIEDNLIPQLIQLVVQELTQAVYKPEDINNNGKDDLSKVVISQKNNN